MKALTLFIVMIVGINLTGCGTDIVIAHGERIPTDVRYSE